MFRQQSKYSWPEGEYLWFTGRLQPGNSEVKVIGESKYSKDNRFNSFLFQRFLRISRILFIVEHKLLILLILGKSK